MPHQEVRYCVLCHTTIGTMQLKSFNIYQGPHNINSGKKKKEYNKRERPFLICGSLAKSSNINIVLNIYIYIYIYFHLDK